MIGNIFFTYNAGQSGIVKCFKMRKISFLLLSLCLLSCNTPSTIKALLSLDYKIQKPKSNYTYIQYLDNTQGNKILYLDRISQKILVLDQESRELDSKIEMRTGYEMSSFYYHNEDSLFLGSVDHLYLQTAASLIDLLDYPIVEIIQAHENYSPLLSMDFMQHSFNPLINRCNKLYVGASTFYPSLRKSGQDKMEDKRIGAIDDFGNYSFKYLEKASPLLVFEFSPEFKINNLQNVFPQSYLGSRSFLPKGIINSNAMNIVGEIIFSFGCDHNLVVLHSDGIKEEHLVPSRYIDDFIPVEYELLKNNKVWKEREITEPFYLGIKYDSYRDQYYRIAVHGQELYEQAGLYNTVFSASFSVMVISNDFVVENEYFFNGGEYLVNSFFVCKEGFAMLKQNTKNLIFDVFEQ